MSTRPRNVIPGHRIRWYVWAGGERFPHAATMRGFWPGWDAECECGWATRTGGAIRAYVAEEVWFHKWEARHGLLEN